MKNEKVESRLPFGDSSYTPTIEDIFGTKEEFERLLKTKGVRL